MSLADFQVAKRTITVPSGGGVVSFDVRAVCTQDISNLLRGRMSEIEVFFANFKANAGAGKKTDAKAIGTKLLDSAPDLICQLIAICADEPAMAPTVAMLPIGKQLEALEAIADLTFEAEGGPEKFLESVMRLLSGTTGLVQNLTPSMNGMSA